MVSDRSGSFHCSSFSAIFAKFDKGRFRSCGKQILDRTIDGAVEVKARVKNRGGGGGYSEFEPIHQRSDEDDEEEETASLTSGRTYSSMSSSSTASGASQMSRDDEVRSMQSRSHMLARMQKQTSRAQHRTNIRERYGLQPDMLDTAFVLGSKILMNKGNASSARTKSAEGTSAAKRLMFW